MSCCIIHSAYSRNKYTHSTGLIQWMLNNAWPEMVWHLYDWYLNVGGAFFGVRKALEPLHPMFAYDDNTVWCVNSMFTAAKGLAVKAVVVDLAGDVKYTQSSDTFNVTVDGAVVSAAHV